MSPEAQRIAIAEACGWRAEQWSKPNDSWFLYSPNGERHSDPSYGTREAAFDGHAPNYLNDLNAMREVENKLLTAEQRCMYREELATVCNCRRRIIWMDWTGPDVDLVINATACQRAEAFLRTVGAWQS